MTYLVMIKANQLQKTFFKAANRLQINVTSVMIKISPFLLCRRTEDGSLFKDWVPLQGEGKRYLASKVKSR